MRIISLINLIAFFVVFGVYISFIDSLIEGSTLLKSFIFCIVVYVLHELSERIQRRFGILEKRIDRQLSVMIVFSLFFIVLLIDF